MNHPMICTGATAALALLSACAALQQAPLLYASKSTVGLDLSTSTTETPGGSISIGVKIVDYAYVPVAVSKVRNAEGKGDVHSEIVPIVAAYGEGATAAGLDALSDDNKRKLQTYLDAKARDQQLEDVLKAQRASRDKLARDLTGTQDRLVALKVSLTEQQALEQKRAADAAAAAASAPTDATPPPPQASDLPRLQRSQQQLEQTATALAPRLAAADADIKATEAELAIRKRETDGLFKAAAEAVSVLRTDKTDAMSVYGRFNTQAEVPAGSASAPSPSAGLTAGKIFSTGVASQNLTEAVRQEAMLTGLAKCVDSVARAASGISSDTERDAILRSMASICSARGAPNGRSAGG